VRCVMSLARYMSGCTEIVGDDNKDWSLFIKDRGGRETLGGGRASIAAGSKGEERRGCLEVVGRSAKRVRDSEYCTVPPLISKRVWTSTLCSVLYILACCFAKGMSYKAQYSTRSLYLGTMKRIKAKHVRVMLSRRTVPRNITAVLTCAERYC